MSGDRSGTGRPPLLRTLLHVLWIVPLVGLAVLALRLDRSTMERGNRLFRGGDPVGAVEIYREAVNADDGAGDGALSGDSAASDVRPLYNLGTALLTDIDPRGPRYLEQVVAAVGESGAATGEEAEALQRTHYNLGYSYLRLLRPDLSQDSALVFLTRSIAHSRDALHQDPTDDDARWNLAVAQLSLDSLLLNMADVDLEQIEGPVEDGVELDEGMLARAESSEPNALPPPENAPPDPDQDADQEESDQQSMTDGAREALSGQDPGPIDADRALEILSGYEEDPGMMVRGILWIHRPDINWWEFTPYPGGDY